jgi:predicted nucleotidyltransferase
MWIANDIDVGGMMRVVDVDEQLLEEIVGRLAAAARPARVIVFGSVAASTAGADSDIDLLVLLDDVTDPRRDSVRLRGVLRGIAVPFDVVVMATQRFEETKHVVGGIAYPAHRYGRVIYEAA